MTTKKVFFQKDGQDLLEGVELEQYAAYAHKVWLVREIPASGIYIKDRELLGTIYAGFVEKLEPGITVRYEDVPDEPIGE